MSEGDPGDEVKKALATRKPVTEETVAAAPKRGSGKKAGKNDSPLPPADEPEISASAFEAPPEGTPPEQIERARGCAELDQNDRDNARRFIIHFGDDIAFVTGMGWLTYNGTHWVRDQGDLGARRLAQDLVDFIKLEARLIEASPAQARALEAAEKALKKPEDKRTSADKSVIGLAAEIRDKLEKRREGRWRFAVGTGNAGKTKAVLEQAAPFKSVEADRLDTDKMQFNVKNGTLRFERRENPDSDPASPTFSWAVALQPHNRADMITKMADVAYDPVASCPLWDAFLARMQPDERMRLFIQVFHAYALLMGGNGEQKLVFHFGEGGNGKSVLLETLGQLGGSYRTVVSPDSMVGDSQRDGSKASGDIARLHSTRFVTVEELPRGTPLRENLVKALTGGSRQVARFNFRDEFEFDPQFTAVMTSNDMPEVSGTDHGIWRRLLIVPWKVRLAEAEQRNFDDVLAEFVPERPGILNWLIEGALKYLNDGLSTHIPAEVRAFTKDYQEERDHVGTFLAACVIRQEGSTTRADDMFKAYTSWCEANAQKPWTQTAFGRYLNTRGYKKDRGKNVIYTDVRLGDVPSRFDPAPKRDDSDPGWSPTIT